MRGRVGTSRTPGGGGGRLCAGRAPWGAGRAAAELTEAATRRVLLARAARQTQANSVLLLPAWPCAWDVVFKVHAPLGTVITGQLKQGRLQYQVTPTSRAGAVKVATCQA